MKVVQQEKSDSNESLLKWWAHQDLNLGPKDYEQPQEIKPYTNQQVTSDLRQCGSKCGSDSTPAGGHEFYQVGAKHSEYRRRLKCHRRASCIHLIFRYKVWRLMPNCRAAADTLPLAFSNAI